MKSRKEEKYNEKCSEETQTQKRYYKYFQIK